MHKCLHVPIFSNDKVLLALSMRNRAANKKKIWRWIYLIMWLGLFIFHLSSTFIILILQCSSTNWIHFLSFKSREFCLLINANCKFWQFWPTQFPIFSCLLYVLLLNERNLWFLCNLHWNRLYEIKSHFFLIEGIQIWLINSIEFWTSNRKTKQPRS